jgi:putative ABC transport system permease protein
MRPPRVARALLRVSLPRDVRDAAVGDLDEEFRTHVVPRAGLRAARAWYWSQAIGSLPSSVKLRAARRTPAPFIVRRRPGTGILMTDLRHGLRLLYRNPTFTLTVMVTHGLGVAVTCAVVSIVYALLRPLPYPDPDRLVHLHELVGGPESAPGHASYPDYLELRRGARSFERIAGYSGGSRTLTLPGAPAERLVMAEATDGLFETLGVAPAMGRLFDASDTRRDAPSVVMLSDGAWRRRFGADPSIVGRAVSLNGQPHTVIAVLPAGFEFPLRGLAELWLPVRPSRAQQERQYFHWMDVIARLKKDVGPDQVRDDLARVAHRFTDADPVNHPAPRLTAVPLHDEMIGSLRTPMLVLTAAVALVMLVTCANVAGLLLARAAGRDREMSVRAAVGASRGRLVSQLLVESLLLGIPGGLLGIAAGHAAARAFVASLPVNARATLPNLQDLAIDPGIASLSVAIAVAAALLFGAAPMWRYARANVSAGLAGAGRSSPGVAVGRLRNALVVTQVALALMLLAGAGLIGKSVYRLLQVSPGFDATNLLTARLNLPPAYEAGDRALQFHHAFLDRIRALPGVVGAESIDQLPLTGSGNNGSFAIDGQPHDPVTESGRSAGLRTISPGYFRVMRIPLLAGRAFSNETATGTPVVVVNRTFAQRFFGGAPLGHRISFVFFRGEPQWEIIGVVGDEQFVELDRDPIPVVYFSAAQDSPTAFSIVVRAHGDSASLTPSIRAAAAEMDRQLPIFGVRTMEQILSESPAVLTRRIVLSLLAIFAGATVILAAVGIYGVLAEALVARTREIGVRVALGAARRDVVRLMLRRGLTPVVIGVVIGVPAALASARMLRSLLYEVTATDVTTLTGVVVAILAVAAIACAVPTWRAVRLDPASAIRQE